MAERPVSVTIFGILNIGFGVVGLGGLVLQKAFESMASNSPNATANSAVALMAKLNEDPTMLLWRHISIPLEGVASAFLLASGIGLLLLKNWARLGAIGYAVYKSISVAANIAVLCIILPRLEHNSGQGVSSMIVGVVAGAVFAGVILTLVYPGLLIYFMTRPKVVQAFGPAPPAALPGL